MTKTILARLFAMTVIAAALVAVPSAAQAREEEEPIRPKAEEGWTTTVEYDPMVVADPSSVDHEPETCALVPWCSLVKIVPEYPAGWNPEVDEFVITTTISWQSTPIVPGTAESNDLDIYVYTYEDVIQDDGTTEKEYREVNRAASGRQPERMKLFGPPPDNPTLYMVVYNFNGPNLGFKVDMDVNVVTYADPDSYYPLAPGVSGTNGFEEIGGSGSGGFESTTVPFTPSAFEPRSPSQLPSIMPVPSAAPSGLTPSPTFSEGFDGFRPLSEDLAGDRGPGILDAVRARVVGTPKPVGAPVLVFWLVLVPLALLAAGAVWLMRRQPAALRVAT